MSDADTTDFAAAGTASELEIRLLGLLRSQGDPEVLDLLRSEGDLVVLDLLRSEGGSEILDLLRSEGDSPDKSDAEEHDSASEIDKRNQGRAFWDDISGNELFARYQKTNELDDLSQSIVYGESVLQRLSHGNPDQRIVQSKLSARYLERYDRRRNEADLNRAVDLAGQAYRATSSDDPELGTIANDYSEALGKRFKDKGDLDDLHRSVALAEEAVNVTRPIFEVLSGPIGTTRDDLGAGATILSNLADRLCSRFEAEWASNDLNRAIDIMERLLAAAPEHEDRPHWFHNLQGYLARRYEQPPHSPDDLVLAVQTAEQAMQGTDDDDKDRATILTEVGLRLAQRAQLAESLTDLDRAIMLFRRAAQITPNCPNHIGIQINIAMGLYQSWRLADSMEHLQEAIDIATSISDSMDAGHREWPHVNNVLGLFHSARYFWDPSAPSAESDAKVATQSFQVALDSPNYTPVFRRVQAGRSLVRLYAVMGNWQQAYNVAELAIRLVPKLTLRSLETWDKQRVLSEDDVVGFGCDAAAAALNAGVGPYAALGLLDLGRGALVSSVSELRADVTALHRADSNLAQRFIRLRNALQGSGARQSHTGKEFDDLIEVIRRTPTFERFLAPPNEQDIHKAAMGGTIVVINVSRYRGADAILITPDKLRVLRLERIELKDLEERSKDLKNPKLLEWLWDVLTQPVLSALGYTQPGPEGNFPRIWWIPTGALSRFPLHAAGYHNSGSGDTVLDRVVSSYSSSIKALLQAPSRDHPFMHKESTSQPMKSLLVAMPSTPQHSSLSYAEEEVRVVESLLRKKKYHVTALTNQPRKQNVLRNMEASQMFHFAGHGEENPSNPSQSKLLLDDWDTDPLTVSSMLEKNLREGPRFLAYLSACETGQVTESRFLDESIHLISAYQLAGFRHVIGTLWAVKDFACVQMAKATYESIFKKPLEDASVAQGLHMAARKLRGANSDTQEPDLADTGQAIASRKAELFFETKKAKLEWVPYVHFGV